ncbi:hypothetical protein [Priestia endophytica]|uniref:Uncharacterized protein n=1 Tax=Priestia endophytica TaxID=135735 RepID=A0AAX1QEW5_9BACI|nr:hypothetical protein [Priestia endophytica]RAS81955.1 hypothetical protein A3864_00170 [Priestia endophytica]RAS86475.1 hypothetical protein A3863_17860 [Priestia endophytica]RAS86506.1 hypothetical protein A3863_18045 [Priestia endophytica]
MIIVAEKHALHKAVSHGEQTIMVKGMIGKLLSPLANVQQKPKDLCITMTPAVAAAIIAPHADITTALAITLILVIGLVTIVSIFKDYHMENTYDGLVLQKKA